MSKTKTKHMRTQRGMLVEGVGVLVEGVVGLLREIGVRKVAGVIQQSLTARRI